MRLSNATTATRLQRRRALAEITAVLPKTLTVAFAADARYLPKLLAVVVQLRSMKKGKSYRLIAYNLGGLAPRDAALVRCAAPVLLDELRTFDFAAYPPHVKELSCYAWKPLLLHALHREFPNEGLVWLDSGLTLNVAAPWKGNGPDPGGFLERALAAAQAQGGVVSDKTGGTFEQWTHPKAMQYFETQLGFTRDFFVGPGVEAVHNCNGAFSAWAPLAAAGPAAAAAAAASFATRREQGATLAAAPPEPPRVGLRSYAARGAVALARWAACAAAPACVCPAGSNRGNHRQDQAALTMTLATLGLRCYDSTTTGPHRNGTRWVAAHGLRMNRVACQDAACFVRTHAPHCAASLSNT